MFEAFVADLNREVLFAYNRALSYLAFIAASSFQHSYSQKVLILVYLEIDDESTRVHLI